MNGWMGKLLRINLTQGTSKIEDILKENLSKFLGGRGLGAKYLFDEVDSNVEPLSPENKLIFTVGPLTGTKVPTSGRYNLSTKSPLTGTIFDSSSGGKWGPCLKKCGFDALIIEGKSETPVYITIKDENIVIKSAEEIWGKDVWATTDNLTKSYGEKASVACIGPAGENLVKMASIVNDKSGALARGGVGAVMGSKNLKAIVVQGTKQISVADNDKLDFILYEADKWIKANPITSQGLPEFGTPVFVNLFNELGIFPSRNFQKSEFPESEKISGETIAETLTVKQASCHSCSIQCTRIVKGSNGEVEGPDYESIWALGPQCGISDLTTIVEANLLCSKLGLDTISTGVTIGCTMELADKGLIQDKINFGEYNKLCEVIESIANRQGLGDEMAEGSKAFAAKHNGEYYSMQVKGLELPAYDPRGMQGMGLGFATSNQGASHQKAYMVGPEVLGVPKMVDRFAYSGKAGLTIFYQNSKAAMDSLILCGFLGLALSEEYFARMLSAVVGINYQPQDLHIIGERIWNLEKLYNIREGFTKEDDTLPKRLLEEPIIDGPSKGAIIHLEPMLRDYYRFRGWDNNGIPGEKKLLDIGLEGYHA